MENVFDLLIIILLGGSSILAFFAALVLLVPEPVMKTRKVLEERGGRSLLLGLVNFVFFGLLVVLCAWLAEQTSGVLAAVFMLIGGAVALAVSVLIILGLVALAELLGKRIGQENTPFFTVLRGGGVLLLAGLAPYIGWLLFTPLAVWAGLGAAISALLRKRGQPASVEEAA